MLWKEKYELQKLSANFVLFESLRKIKKWGNQLITSGSVFLKKKTSHVGRIIIGSTRKW